MIEIRKITEKDKYHRNAAIKYVVQLGELKSYLTEKALIELRSKLNTFVLCNVIKCSNCGDTGRGKPTLQEPDGEECKECLSSCLQRS